MAEELSSKNVLMRVGRSYFQDNFVVDHSLLNLLQAEGILKGDFVTIQSKKLHSGLSSEVLMNLLQFIEDFFVMDTLAKFCTCLEKQSVEKPKYKEIAKKICNAMFGGSTSDKEDCRGQNKERESEEEVMPPQKKPHSQARDPAQQQIISLIREEARSMVHQAFRVQRAGFQNCIGHFDKITEAPEVKEISQGSSDHSGEGQKETTETTSKTFLDVMPPSGCLEWTLLPPLPESVQYCSAAASEDTLYALLRDKLYKYALNTSKWVKMLTPGVITMSAIAVTEGKHLHFIGGVSGGEVSSKCFHLIDAKSKGTWRVMVPLKVARWESGAVGYKSIIIVAGGYSSSRVVEPSVEVVNVAQSQPIWYNVLQLPCPLIHPYIACNEKKTFIGLGKMFGNVCSNSYFEYATKDFIKAANREINEISFDTHITRKTIREGAALAIMADLLLIGGRNQNTVSLANADHSFFSYLHYARSDAQVTCNSESIFVLGGTFTERIRDTLERHIVCTVEQGKFV
jgi:hypothetical protein